MNPSKTALIVEDEDQLRRLMARVLERAGFQSWTAGDGIEALRIFQEHAAEIDVVLLDVFHPPGAGAADLLPKLLERKSDLDVILTSGDALSESLAKELIAIGGRFLRKPFVPKTLVRMLAGEDGPDPVAIDCARHAGSGAA